MNQFIKKHQKKTRRSFFGFVGQSKAPGNQKKTRRSFFGFVGQSKAPGNQKRARWALFWFWGLLGGFMHHGEKGGKISAMIKSQATASAACNATAFMHSISLLHMQYSTQTLNKP